MEYTTQHYADKDVRDAMTYGDAIVNMAGDIKAIKISESIEDVEITGWMLYVTSYASNSFVSINRTGALLAWNSLVAEIRTFEHI